VRPENFISLFEIGIAGFDDFGEAEGPHDFADLNGRMYWDKSSSRCAWWGRWRDIYFGEGLAFGDGGRGDSVVGDVGSDEAGGAIGDNPLAIGGWHEEE